MIVDPKMFIWRSNPDWYDYDENEEPYLTDKAPEEAKESFEIWKEIQKIRAKDPKILY